MTSSFYDLIREETLIKEKIWEPLQILVEELKGKPGKLYPLQCDMSVQSEIERAVLWIEKTLGGVDVLINNAGINIDSSCINGGIEELKKTLDVNVLGLTCITKGILKLMKSKGKYQASSIQSTRDVTF